MTNKPVLKLQWERAVSGYWFASTGDVAYWQLVLDTNAMAINSGTEVVAIRMRTKKNDFDAMAEAEEFALQQLRARYGRLMAGA